MIAVNAVLLISIGLCAVVVGGIWSRRYLLNQMPAVTGEHERRHVQEIADKVLEQESGLPLLYEACVVVFLGSLCWLADRHNLPLWLLLTAVIVAIPILLVGRYWAIKSRVQRSVRTWLVQQGYPLCVRCGYDLRGLTDPRCPECGSRFDPDLLKQPARPSSADKEKPCPSGKRA